MDILDRVKQLQAIFESEPRSMDPEPRNMYASGQLVQNTADGSRPGYKGNYSKDKTALSADVIKKIKNKIKLPVGQKWSFYDPNPNSKTYNPNGDTYGIKKSKFPKLWERGRNIGKEGRAEKKLIQATDAYKKIKANPDLLAEKQLYDRELYMGKREQILEDLNFKYATDKKFREAKLEYDKIQRIENPEKYKQKTSDFYAKHGKFPPGNNYKENVWHDMFRSSQKKGQKRFLLVNEKGKLLTLDNFPKVNGKVRWDVDGAYKKVRFKDLKTGQYVKFDNTIKKEGIGFQKYLDQKSVGGKGAYENAVNGYRNADDYKNLTFKNAKGEKIRLGTLMQSKLKTKTDFIKSGINIQHPDLNNAFWKNEVSTASSNMKLRDYEKTLNSKLKAYKNDPIKSAKALAKFKTNLEKLPGGITKIIEGTTYGIRPTAKSVISEVGKEFGANRYKDFKNILTGWCSQGKQIVKKAGGGRIGFGGCSDGEKITNMKNAASKLKQHKLYLMGKATTTPFASEAAAKALASKMAKSGGLLMRIGKVAMGPLTLWGEPLFEAAFVAHDILGTGTPWKEAVAKSLWAKPAISMGLLKPADQQYDEALWQVQNEDGEALMMDPYHERVRTPIKRFIDNNNKIDKLNKLFTLKQNSHVMGPRLFTQEERETKIKNADETYNNYLKSLGGAEGVRDIENQISEDQEAYDTRVAALEIERKGITEDDIFTPSGLKRPGVEKDADIKQKQAEEDLMYRKYGKTRATNVGIKGTPGEFKEKWITDPEFKSGIDADLKMFGDHAGYGWTPYGHGFGMSNGKYNEDLGYKQLTEFMDYQNSMANIARAGGFANMATGGRAGYMGGGIMAIRRPNAIPPKRQGLRSILINGKKS